MTKSKKESSQVTIFEAIQLAEQLSRQSVPAPAGSMDFDKEFKSAMAEDAKCAVDASGHGITRFEVVARMSEILGEEVTFSTLNNWTATSHSHMPSLKEAAAFVHATGGQRRTMEVLARRAGLFALPGREALRAEIQRFRETEKKAKDERHRRERMLDDIEKRGNQ